ncbi:MAG: rod shape-determining protein MreC [Mucinivorans sp.]
MHKLLLLLRKIYFVLLFLVLEAVALSYYLRVTPLQRARAIAVSHVVDGAFNGMVAGVDGYFSLFGENESLLKENAMLHAQLAELLSASDSTTTALYMADTINPYRVARVVRNSYTQANNFITLDRGLKDSIEPNMALRNSKGMVGYVLYCSDNFSVAMSVLNVADFRTSGRLKGTDFTGSISWDGGNFQTVQLSEVPKFAGIAIGDTVETTTYSNIFPEGIPIGYVKDFTLINATYYIANVRLFADMSSLNYLYATKLVHQEERQKLEANINEQKESN